MTALFLTFTTLTAVLGFSPAVFGPSGLALLIDQDGVLLAVHTDTSTVVWSLETGGPAVWAERLENSHKAQFYPRPNGDLFFIQSDKSPLQKFDKSVQDIAKAGTAEFDWEHYFQGAIRNSAFPLSLKSGRTVDSPALSDNSALTLKRTDYRLNLVEKLHDVTVFQINVSEISIQGCELSDPSAHLQESLRKRFGEVLILGVCSEYSQSEDWKVVLSDWRTLFLLVSVGLAVGFMLGRKAEDEKSQCVLQPCRSPNSEATTASSSALTSPIYSEKSALKSVSSRKICLSVVTQMRLPTGSMELETPLHASSDALIKDLISDGRFADTFESAKLIKSRFGQKTVEARHRLEGKSYIVRVAKFCYNEAETIAEATMFREVAAMIRFRHKHIVNYVTCWVEDGDVIPSEESEEESEEEDRVPTGPVPPNDEQKTGFLYIQRELVKGENLKDLLKHRKVVDRRENCLIFRQILKAVAHIHDKNIVHRGLQPSCIYVTRDGVVKIGDFRLAAKARSAHSRHSLIFPSSPYTAPESLFQEVTKTIDIYPLGLVLLELCLSVGYRDRRSALKDLRARKRLPQELECLPEEKEIILWLSASDPSSRPSAQEVMESNALREWEKQVGLSPCLAALSPDQFPG